MDFAGAIQEGLKAFHEYEFVEKRVIDVLQHVEEILGRTFSCPLRIQWKETSRLRDGRPINPEDPQAKLVDVVRYRGLFLFTERDGSIELARMDLAPEGWPIRLEYELKSVSCRDELAFEREIAEMLKHPQVAGKISKHLAKRK